MFLLLTPAVVDAALGCPALQLLFALEGQTDTWRKVAFVVRNLKSLIWRLFLFYLRRWNFLPMGKRKVGDTAHRDVSEGLPC